MNSRLGQQFGNYRLIRLLGQGGFAEVYLGEHVHLSTRAAVKVLHEPLSQTSIDQFYSEARLIASLIHPHIVRVLDFGIENGLPFLVMDYAPHGSLASRHPRGVPLSLDLVVHYVKHVAAALQYAHAQRYTNNRRLVHRDVKPANMLLGRDHEVLLSDFGLAIVTHSSDPRNRQLPKGTVWYMAPEQILGKARRASDQYALGVVVYEWLTGSNPFTGSNEEIARQHIHVPPPPLRQRIPSLSPVIEQVVLKALEKRPNARFPSVQEFALALERAALSS